LTKSNDERENVK